MDWDAIGAIGQAVSALALVFVIIQVRHARFEMRHSANRDRLEATRDIFLVQATHPELASALGRLWASTGIPPNPFIQHGVASGLTEVEARQVYAYMTAGWQNIQGSIEAVDLLSPGVRQDLDFRLRFLYGGNGGQEKWYELMKSTLNPDAVRYVDNLLAQQGPNSFTLSPSTRQGIR